MYLFIGIAIALVLAAAYAIASMTRLKENSSVIEQVSRELLVRLQNVEGKLADTERGINENLVSIRKEQRDEARAAREEQSRNLASFGDSQSRRIKEIGDLQRESLESFSRQLTDISRLNEEKLEAVRGTVEAKLQEIHKNNEEKLEKMRATVDEQLHSTLEKRLGEAFSTVSERLELVHKGLGEMKALTADVGDLKKVLSNVKVRGTWGETQLRALLEQILTKDQYAENVATRPNCGERVEFAISLPGAGDAASPV
ncbi:MAG: DNA recombination protein RmuC, partial [Synergistaceae bacterium]|nr:DNA recombination protein RmuC [Synergistaceae bacterium]